MPRPFCFSGVSRHPTGVRCPERRWDSPERREISACGTHGGVRDSDGAPPIPADISERGRADQCKTWPLAPPGATSRSVLPAPTHRGPSESPPCLGHRHGPPFPLSASLAHGSLVGRVASAWQKFARRHQKSLDVSPPGGVASASSERRAIVAVEVECWAISRSKRPVSDVRQPAHGPTRVAGGMLGAIPAGRLVLRDKGPSRR